MVISIQIVNYIFNFSDRYSGKIIENLGNYYKLVLIYDNFIFVLIENLYLTK